MSISVPTPAETPLHPLVAAARELVAVLDSVTGIDPMYAATTDIFETQYAIGIDALLPSATAVGDLESQGQLPTDALFKDTPPNPMYASITPATSPTDLAVIFVRGFGSNNLLNNAFRLAYLQDATSNPDGGFPTLSDGLPPASPAHPFRQALKTNDQRVWTPTSPMLPWAWEWW